MKDINDLMPKIPGLRWGAVTNLSPTLANINMLNRQLKHDGKWHTIIHSENDVNIDGITVRRKTMDSMT